MSLCWIQKGGSRGTRRVLSPAFWVWNVVLTSSQEGPQADFHKWVSDELYSHVRGYFWSLASWGEDQGHVQYSRCPQRRPTGSLSFGVIDALGRILPWWWCCCCLSVVACLAAPLPPPAAQESQTCLQTLPNLISPEGSSPLPLLRTTELPGSVSHR